LSVRAVEKILPSMFVLDSGRAVKHSFEATKEARPRDTKIVSGEVLDRLRSYLGTKVRIKSGDGKKGKLIIEYFSEEELGRIVDLISSKEGFLF
jgi:ParB family transcriptional regulator, chromosome partitioning protein